MNYKLFNWEEKIFYIFENVYEPAEDTFLIAQNLNKNFSDFVLDMGSGCGILAILSALNAIKVIAVDINPYAVQCIKLNVMINKVSEKVDVIQSNLFSSIKEAELFNLILFNAPYIPLVNNDPKDWMEYAWAGGKRGRTIIDRFISDVTKYLKVNGEILLVQSTISGVNETIKKLNAQGLKASIMEEKKIDFETITLIKAEKK